MNSKTILVVVSVITAIIAVFSWRILYHTTSINPSISEQLLLASTVVAGIVASFIAQRWIFYISEPMIRVADKSILINQKCYIEVRNFDTFDHLDIKVFLEVYDTVRRGRNGTGSMYLIRSESASLGSINRGNGGKLFSSVYLPVSTETLSSLVPSRPTRTSLLSVTVISVHRFTNARGMIKQEVEVTLPSP